MTMANPTPRTTTMWLRRQQARFSSWLSTHTASKALMAGAAFISLLLGVGYWSANATIDTPLTKDASTYSCKGKEEVVPMSQHPDQILKKVKGQKPQPPPVTSDSTFDSKMGGVIALLTINPDSDYAKNGFAITAGQLLKGDEVTGAFTVASPGSTKSIRLTPVKYGVEAPPETRLKICLTRQS